jgi:hypothetical protein
MIIPSFRLCVIALAVLAGASARAGALSHVATGGVDSGDCANPASPCRSLSYALGQTTTGGEIRLQEPGHYGGVIIRKSINITGVTGAGIVRNMVGDSITITAGASGVVTLTGLTVNGMNVGTNGLRVNSAGQVVIKDCIFKNHLQRGVSFQATTPIKFYIEDTLFASNRAAGIYLTAETATPGSTVGVAHRVTITGGGASSKSSGVVMVKKADLRLSDSVIANHGDRGVFADRDETNKLRLSGNTITQNVVGVAISGVVPASASTAFGGTAQDNFIRGNGTDVDSATGFVPLTNIGVR